MRYQVERKSLNEYQLNLATGTLRRKYEYQVIDTETENNPIYAHARKKFADAKARILNKQEVR